ncbi:unnamed protein product, partial [Rotaria sp. Silwood2]
FIRYFNDEICKPLELVPEATTGKNRKLINHQSEVERYKSILQYNDSQLTLVEMFLLFLETCQNNVNYDD